jgi:DNA-binding LytR/AlgR family response regulator
MTRCLIVDDEPVARRIISSYLEEIPETELVASCPNAIAAMEVLQRERVDLLLLDIEMPKLKGLDFIRSLSHPPAIILTTAYREFALDAFDLGVVDYLLKPIRFERFFQAFQKFKKERTPLVKEAPKAIMLFRSDRKTYRIAPDDILYIEGLSNYVRIFLLDRQLTVYNSLTAMEQELPSAFLRVHKSYIVNTGALDAFSHESIEIGGKEIPIGGVYKKNVLERLNRHS